MLREHAWALRILRKGDRSYGLRRTHYHTLVLHESTAEFAH